MTVPSHASFPHVESRTDWWYPPARRYPGRVLEDDLLALHPPAAEAEEVTLHVDGMTCPKCVGRVERALLALPGVASAAVDLASNRAVVSGTCDLPSILAALDDAGYPARLDAPGGGAAAPQEVRAAPTRREFTLQPS